ncbi:MAG: glycogen debranching protein GlgX [Pseudomonadota bacterium]
MNGERVLAGSPFPLGARWDGAGTNFALFSAHATKVELCFFDRAGRRELARIPLPEFTHEVWHGYFPDIRPGQLYGYRVHGPYAPEAGHRFNPNKLLIDPYALEVRGELRWHDAAYGYRIGHRQQDLSFDRRDSAFIMPKCVVVDPAVTWGNDIAPRISWDETVLYEAHVKGMTARHASVPGQLRGTFGGFAEPAVIDHLKRLGVTTVELMPVQLFYDDRHLLERGLSNYWGYNTLNFFAPAMRFISPGQNIHEFKFLVRRLHEAGIEAILDVVYNHTAEGNQLGPTLSLRGIDNASYYMLAETPRYYYDTTGCGNTLNLAHGRVLQMVMDSLRYWVDECHVDGFRFDLAAALGRNHSGFDPHAIFLDALAQDPVLSKVKLIAEPWDTGNEGYQLGNFPPGWAEWNDKYRDTIRSFWKGDAGAAANFASRIMASADLFDKHGRRPWSSVNFAAAHDGFTLMDVVSFNDKHNEANGEGNRDGHGHNLSWNCGAEGPSDDPNILDLRDRMRRNLIATVLVSQGAPMILMGDEIGRSQSGNNNAYCQDNAMSWMPWQGMGEREQAFATFVAGLVRLRRHHPLLRQAKFPARRSPADAPLSFRWLRPDGLDMAERDWKTPETRALALLMSADDQALLLIFNAHFEPVDFALPQMAPHWTTLIDTATAWAGIDGNRVRDSRCSAPSRSLLLLEAGS